MPKAIVGFKILRRIEGKFKPWGQNQFQGRSEEFGVALSQSPALKTRIYHGDDGSIHR